MTGKPNPAGFLVKRLEAMRKKGDPDSEILKKLQARLELSNVGLAEMLDVSERQVYRWRSGGSQPPQSILLLLDVLGLSQ